MNGSGSPAASGGATAPRTPPLVPPSLPIPPHVLAVIHDRTWLVRDLDDDDKDDSDKNDNQTVISRTLGRARAPPSVVVGVDYGTTFSGFAWARIGTQGGGTAAAPPPIIRVNTNWDHQPPGIFSAKLPTVSVYSRPGSGSGPGSGPHGSGPGSSTRPTLLSWGWRAAADFSGTGAKLALAKLALHPDTPAHRRPVIPAGLSVEDVVADYLAELAAAARECIGDDVEFTEDVRWCFTVPVNWPASALSTLRMAAHRAGLTRAPESRALTFLEEPEAAALTCLEDVAAGTAPGPPMPPGSAFLVVDAGGGTVDTFHCTLDAQSRLDEITVGAGAFLGASFVDARFLAFLREQLGSDAFEALTEEPRLASTWREFEAKWEAVKRSYRGPMGSASGTLTTAAGSYETLMFTLSLYRELSDDVKDRLRDRQDGVDDELRIAQDDLRAMFDPVVMAIRDLVVAQLQSAAAGSVVDRIVLVGGFGANRYLHSVLAHDPAIAARVGAGGVRVAPSPEAAVVGGAVRYGLDRARIRTRRAKSTLGLLVHANAAAVAMAQAAAAAAAASTGTSPSIGTNGSPPTASTPVSLSGESGDAALTSTPRILTVDGATYLVLVKRGDPVPYDAVVVHHHLALGDRSTTGAVKIYELSDAEDTGRGGDANKAPSLVGRVEISAPLTPGIKRRVTLLVHFGALELRVRAVSEMDGREWQASVRYDVTSDGRRPPTLTRASTAAPAPQSGPSRALADSRSYSVPDMPRHATPLPGGGVLPSPPPPVPLPRDMLPTGASAASMASSWMGRTSIARAAPPQHHYPHPPQHNQQQQQQYQPHPMQYQHQQGHSGTAGGLPARSASVGGVGGRSSPSSSPVPHPHHSPRPPLPPPPAIPGQWTNPGASPPTPYGYQQQHQAATAPGAIVAPSPVAHYPSMPGWPAGIQARGTWISGGGGHAMPSASPPTTSPSPSHMPSMAAAMQLPHPPSHHAMPVRRAVSPAPSHSSSYSSRVYGTPPSAGFQQHQQQHQQQQLMYASGGYGQQQPPPFPTDQRAPARHGESPGPYRPPSSASPSGSTGYQQQQRHPHHQ
ncbi:hypothetical protein BC828DRAFT_398701 [Blastocladiella britannica]|nr:hypothetical protein BC828DRAFT_398701 [Blastocladiella britannica]